MQKKVKQVYGSFRNKAVVASAIALGLMANAHAVIDTTEAVAAVGEGKTAVLAVVAVGGAALLAIAGGKVVWTLGAKWISRLASKG